MSLQSWAACAVVKPVTLVPAGTLVVNAPPPPVVPPLPLPEAPPLPLPVPPPPVLPPVPLVPPLLPQPTSATIAITPPSQRPLICICELSPLEVARVSHE